MFFFKQYWQPENKDTAAQQRAQRLSTVISTPDNTFHVENKKKGELSGEVIRVTPVSYGK